MKVLISMITIMAIIAISFGISLIKKRKRLEKLIRKYGNDEWPIFNYYKISNNNNSKRIAQILSNNQIEEADNYINELYNKKYIVKIMAENKVVESVNLLLERLGYKVNITNEDIEKNDNEFIKNRRRDKYTVILHDINNITNILRNENYEIINIIENNSNEYNLAIIPSNKIIELTKICNGVEI